MKDLYNQKKSLITKMSEKKSKHDLEEAVKEKVAPLLEETMEKQWGITIPKLGEDISDQLKETTLNLYVPQDTSFSKAKKLFKTEFLKRELGLHRGNISNLAKVLEIDRRSIHRAIKDLAIDVEKIKNKLDSKERYQEEVVGKAIRTTLEGYEEIIKPEKMEKMYQELPALSRNIAKFLPHQDLTWKEAESEFEKQFLAQALEDHDWKVGETASKIRIRAETLHRKIKRLGLKR